MSRIKYIADTLLSLLSDVLRRSIGLSCHVTTHKLDVQIVGLHRGARLLVLES